MKIIHPLICCIALALTAGANAAPPRDDFPLIGNYTQNVPCKGDGSDPAELHVKISAQAIDSKVGVCTFLDTKRSGESINAHVECDFPAGPLVGDVTFTIRPDNTIEFIDRDQNYRSMLYRCPQ